MPYAQVVEGEYEVAARLQRLGLSRPPLIEAAMQGDLQRRLCTGDDFYATPGYAAWARTLRIVRERLRSEHGWHNGEFLGIPVSYDSDEYVAVAVSTGDDRTGLPGPDPQTNVKGPATGRAVEMSSQGSFDLDERGVDLWYLLTFATEEGELRAELSSPRLTDEENRIAGWHERILFGRIDPDVPFRITAPGIVPSDINIDVGRKSA